jgi:N4-gp56 family major capsid protein
VATFQWQFDAPSGTYKQHALSRRLYMASLENAVFMDHVTPVEGYGKKQGENVTLTRIATITEPTSADLTEGVRIPEDTFSITTTSITVVEIGRAIPFTSFAVDLSFLDLENNIQRRLRDQMGLVLDTKAATAFKTAKVKYVPTGLAAGTFTTNGTPSASATANLNVFHVEEIRDYLFDTLQTPPAEGDKYVGIFRTLGLRGIKRDPDWEEWHKYTDPQAKFNNEIGMIENVRFIETNHSNALAKQGTSSVLGEGVIFGSDGIALAEVQTPELRAQTNVGQDFGRAHAVAWYGILEFGIIWDTGNAGEARIVHVTST